jgi:hypothetical protein
MRGRLTEGGLGAKEFGGVWHWHVTEILVPDTDIPGPTTHP